MGGRGSNASGKDFTHNYKTVAIIDGIKVLVGINGKHGLPEEAHKSNAYIQLNKDGSFHEIRFYDKDHYLTLEIANHIEPSLQKTGKPIIHYHIYDRDFHRTKAIKATKAMIKHIRNILEGLKNHEKW